MSWILWKCPFRLQRYSFITTLFLGPFDDVITKFYCMFNLLLPAKTYNVVLIQESPKYAATLIMQSLYFHMTITIIVIIHRPVFYLKHDVSETGLSSPSAETYSVGPNGLS
jgi:hypothetical protein